MLYDEVVSSLSMDERFSIDQPPLGAETHVISVTVGDVHVEKEIQVGSFAPPRYPDRIVDELWSVLSEARKTRDDLAKAKKPFIKRVVNYVIGR
jgi:hypothetical protein